MLDQLSSEIPQLIDDQQIVNIITTGFHVKEVRKSLGNLPVDIDILIMNLNPETRRKLVTIGEEAKYGIICRDLEAAILWKDLIKTELGFTKFNVDSCLLSESRKVKSIMNSVDVLLTSPPVFEQVKEIIPFDLPIFNVFERIDPMSLQVIKEKFSKV